MALKYAYVALLIDLYIIGLFTKSNVFRLKKFVTLTYLLKFPKNVGIFMMPT